jgi:hypothetical protein
MKGAMMWKNPAGIKNPHREFGNMEPGPISLHQFLKHLLSRKAEGNGPKKP